MKAARTVRSGGKGGDNIKTLPIAIHGIRKQHVLQGVQAVSRDTACIGLWGNQDREDRNY